MLVGGAVGTALAVPVKNMSEMGSSEFTARAQPCIFSSSGPSYRALVFVRKPTEWVALVTRMADVYERRDACRTLYFCKITRNFPIFSLGKYFCFTRDPNYKYCIVCM